MFFFHFINIREVKLSLRTEKLYRMLSNLKLYTCSLRRFHSIRFASIKSIDYSLVPKINEKDLEESFVRGSGPGGQAVNKTANCVILKHVPTGIIIKCHEHRSVSQNRKSAREILTVKLDNLQNGINSIEAQKKAIESKKNADSLRKHKKMDELKRKWKEREGIT